MAAYGTFVQKTHALKRFQKQIVNQEAFQEKGLAFLMRTCLSHKPQKTQVVWVKLFFRLIECIAPLYVAKLPGCIY